MLQRIPPDQVRLGMFIQGFDGSWWQHPFWRSRFVLSRSEDLEKLAASDVKAVVIDTSRGIAPEPDAVAVDAKPMSRSAVADGRTTPTRLFNGPRSYADEKSRAAQVMNHSKRVMRGVFDGARLGKAIRTADVVDVVEEISASVERNSKALIGITRLKSKDEYTYLHSVAVCALMVNLARHIGVPPAEIQAYGIAGLLHDVGKMAVPDMILNKPGALSDAEFVQMQRHPDAGHAMLLQTEGLPALALDVCRHHHEKVDGSGYPLGLAGEGISVAARMGAICDVYDALTSNRAYKTAWTPVEAITAMRSWKGHFDPALMFRFMQSISVFPTGMLVRLRSNRLAVVLDNGRRASRPRVRAFFSTSEIDMIQPAVVTIDDNLASDQIISQESPDAWGLSDWPALQRRLLEDA